MPAGVGVFERCAMKVRHRGFVIEVEDWPGGAKATVYDPMESGRVREVITGTHGWQALEFAQAAVNRWLKAEAEKIVRAMEASP